MVNAAEKSAEIDKAVAELLKELKEMPKTKQEEIREGLISKVKSIRLWANNPDDPLSPEDDADDILNNLHSKGCVRKVDLPQYGLYMPRTESWLTVHEVKSIVDSCVEPLIESESKGIDGKPYIAGVSGMGSSTEPLVEV